MKIIVRLLLLLVLVAATNGTLPAADAHIPTNEDSHDTAKFNPQDARYFSLINDAFQLTPEELAMLEQNGFVVTDRLSFQTFSELYAYVFWQDLPVLVTTDSLLHSIHQSYDNLLKDLELAYLGPQMVTVLAEGFNAVRTAREANTDPALVPLYDDLETYFAVPLALLTAEGAFDGSELNILDVQERTRISYNLVDAASIPFIDPERTQDWVVLIEAGQPANITFMGATYTVDFSIFTPRGHYTGSPHLKAYFKAMSWLGEIEWRLVEYDLSGTPHLNAEQLAGALLLRDALATQRPHLNDMDALLTLFVGASDNTTLADLDRFMEDAGLENASDVLAASNTDMWRDMLASGLYGRQQIVGSIQQGGVAPPVSLALVGKRFALDSWVMSEVVYDRIPSSRSMPSTFDVFYALGNDRAADFLGGEFAAWGYQDQLTGLRDEIDALPAAYWTRSTYTYWLAALRTLNADTTAAHYPASMQTEAWADKTLHTQHASWAQLRHDNILYVAQGYMSLACEYPAGYVEPYPAFYTSLEAYTQASHDTLAALDTTRFNPYARQIVGQAMMHFEAQSGTMAQLAVLAEKELNNEPFTEEEELFVRSIVKRQLVYVNVVCAVETRTYWDGWYVNGFYGPESGPILVADVHTDPNDGGRVLHVGTGPVAAMLFMVDETLYVGPAFTYFDFVEPDFSRVNDDEWEDRLFDADAYPDAPQWVSSFRIPVDAPPPYQRLPEVNINTGSDEIPMVNE